MGNTKPATGARYREFDVVDYWALLILSQNKPDAIITMSDVNAVRNAIINKPYLFMRLGIAYIIDNILAVPLMFVKWLNAKLQG